jgi:hypothetical protein
VAFPRKTPFQAVIEAARNIEADLTAAGNGHEAWRVDQVETRYGVTSLCLVRPDGQHELKMIPVQLPDGREDVFYPYLTVEDRHVRFPHDFQHPEEEGRIYRHARDLRKGDGIHVYPALIADVFMDNTARRYECFRPKPLAAWRAMRDLWKLVERSVPGQTALRGAWAMLVEKRDGWRGTDGNWIECGEEAWLDFVCAVFHERLRLRGESLETLVRAAADGILDWCLEWHMSVLKKHVSGLPVRGRTRTRRCR